MIIGLNDGPIGGNNGKNMEFYEFVPRQRQ